MEFRFAARAEKHFAHRLCLFELAKASARQSTEPGRHDHGLCVSVTSFSRLLAGRSKMHHGQQPAEIVSGVGRPGGEQIAAMGRSIRGESHPDSGSRDRSSRPNWRPTCYARSPD